MATCFRACLWLFTFGKVLYENGEKYQGAEFGPEFNQIYSVKDIVVEFINQIGYGNYKVVNSDNTLIESKVLRIDIQKAKNILIGGQGLILKNLIKMTIEEYNINGFSSDEVIKQRNEHINYYFSLY